MNHYTMEFLKGVISPEDFFEDALMLFLIKSEVKKKTKLPPEFFDLLKEDGIRTKFLSLLKPLNLNDEVNCLRFVQNKKKEWVRRNKSYPAGNNLVMFVPVQDNVIHWFNAYQHTGRILYPVIDL